ncbi:MULTISPECIES: gas vesicle protein [unclassified Haladaptatus]|uniref:gas vesicle protein GvpJ n=1 Tax=unclassified Haladaptatus TaxID=2622732 RepID=UPI00209C2B4F|nr:MULTISPECIES: gas vesicle protein [unclassified Haladaptatus]MCO8243946.1 gas vesicle protein [Haladaptatus sp. AB643]MCO8256481.1 gas vesicle protein [Haladaptatus sp. AB618]
MGETGPTRSQSDLAEMLELLLDKGVVINADIVVTVGETELLGVKLRAAIASFETAAQYGLEFPEGTDMKRVEEAAGVEELPESETVTVGVSPDEEGDDEAETDDEDADADDSDEDGEEEETEAKAEAEAEHDGD